MNRWLTAAILPMSCVGLGVGLPSTGVADPSTGAESGQCTWVPLPPTVVTVAGTKMVTAGLQQGSCTLLGNPSEQTVCLAIQGDDTPGNCSATPTTNPAQVFYNYVPGSTYVMRARGCLNRLTSPNTTLCQTFGPSYYKL